MNYVNIELDKPRRLRYDINALSDLEESLGVGLNEAMKIQMGVRVIRNMLWAGLKWEDRGLTKERVGAIMQQYLENGGNLEELAEKAIKALLASGLYRSGDQGNAEAEAAK